MQQEGPLLERLTHRLSECPEEFLLPPMTVAGGTVHIAALVADHLRKIGVQPDVSAVQERFGPAVVGWRQDENWLRMVAIGVWLLEDDWFLGRPDLAVHAQHFWEEGLQALSRVVDAKTVVTDSDRQEEFVRLCLKHLGLRPSGETIEYATDRLTTLDSVERVPFVQHEFSQRADHSCVLVARPIPGTTVDQAAIETALRTLLGPAVRLEICVDPTLGDRIGKIATYRSEILFEE
jgi:hypothetical protein